jgi:hypothetical protein
MDFKNFRNNLIQNNFIFNDAENRIIYKKLKEYNKLDILNNSDKEYKSFLFDLLLKNLDKVFISLV